MFLALALIAAAQAAASPTTTKPSPKPAPPAFIEGVVNDPRGKPVEKALVVATCSPRGGTIPSARTDVRGRFRLDGIGPGRCSVLVNATGLAPAKRESVRPGAPLVIALEPGRSIEGVVLDGSGGQPIAGARVEAVTGPGLTWEPGTGRVEVLTDAKGRYRLEGLGRDTYDVAAWARGYGRARKPGVKAGQRADLYLFSGASIAGTVLGPGQKPMQGVVIRIEGQMAAGSPPPASTDAQGRFEVLGLQPGAYLVAAWRVGLGAALLSDIVVEGSGQTPVSLTLAEGTAVTGRLLGPNGKPVSGRVTVQELNGTAAPRSLGEVLRAEASADGRFRIEGLPPGSHALAVVAPRHAPARVDFDAGAKPVTDVGDVDLEVGLAIRGRVRDKAGLPIAQAQIFGWHAGPGGDGTRRAEGESEDDGAFVLAGLGEGTYALRFSAQGYGEASKEVDAGAERVDVVLSVGGSITGVVVDEAGRPAETFEVSAEQSDVLLGFGRGKQNTAADGRFQIDELAPGTYVLSVSTPEHALAVLSGLQVASGGTTDAGRIRLQPGGILRGTVTDLAGAPVAGATVTAHSAAARWETGMEHQAMSDIAGSFEVHGVPPGLVQAFARHPQYAQGRTTGLEVDPARGATEVHITLVQGARIEGSARKRDGGAIASAFVQVRPMTAEEDSFEMPALVRVRSDGTFVAEHLAPGRANVILMQGAGPRRVGIDSRDVVLREAETATIDFASREILISGRVTRSGVPAARVRLRFTNRRSATFFMGSADGIPAASGPQHLTAVTREDGGYEAIVDSPGAFKVWAETLDGRTRFPGKDVEVPDADQWTLDFDYAGAAVGGIVVDQSTEQPIARAWIWAEGKEDTGGGVARTGADGRFEVMLDDGNYKISAGADGYARESVDVSVVSGAASDVRLALGHGNSVKGRVVDAGGRGVANIYVTAACPTASSPRAPAMSMTMTLTDGAFEIKGLSTTSCALLTGSALAGFAFKGGVSPGERNAVLTLKPGGRVRVVVRGRDGRPVEGAWVELGKVGSSVVNQMEGSITDADGIAVLATLATSVELNASKDKLRGTTRVEVQPGGLAAAEVTLAADSAASP